MSIAQWAGAGTWRAELPHSNDHHALIWVTRGQGRCLVEGVLRGLSVHSALCVPAHTLFALEMGKQGFGTVCTIPPRSAVLMPDQPVLLRIRDVLAQAELTTILETMQREQNNARPFADEAMMAHASLLTVWLRRAIIDQPDDPPDFTAAQRLVMAYSALVERDYSTGKPMSDYARTLGVTPTHLTRACRASAGMTASELLTRRTVHAVRDLLENTDHPANRVAAMLGFRSAAYFSRFVLQHTGMSPTALRKARKGEKAPTGPATPTRPAPPPSRVAAPSRAAASPAAPAPTPPPPRKAEPARAPAPAPEPEQEEAPMPSRRPASMKTPDT
ncbi:AraC family transcriptional regulator [Roseovarius indicus]|uniref:AraC family transcriptional regulator n=1 Tax=Roseovarius indicus TaxID=540747 RepID=UPI0032ECE0B9